MLMVGSGSEPEDKKETGLSDKISASETDISETDVSETEIGDESDDSYESEIFNESLDGFTENAIPFTEEEKQKVKSERLYSYVRMAIIAVCVCLFVYSGYLIVKTLYDYQRSDDIYSDLAESIFNDGYAGLSLENGELRPSGALKTGIPTPGFASVAQNSDVSYVVEQAEYNEEFEGMKVKLHNLQLKNPDLYGWITIENTNINYPVMQSEDNNYYLDHAYSGVQVVSGSIFCDYRCFTDIMTNYNTILYGHNMRNGKMFNDVTKFLDEDFFDNNKYIKIYTLDGIYTYEVFSIYETEYDYPYITTDFYTRQEFVDFANRVRENSKFVRDGIEFAETDRLLTLSTCTNGFWTGRYALHAVLVNVIN